MTAISHPNRAMPSLRSERRRRRLREALVAYAFVAPWVIGFVIFTGGPILASFGLSFFRWRVITPPTYLGLDNYVRMFTQDEWFRISIGVTLKYLILYIPLSQVLALLLAILLNQRVRLVGVWRTIFYLPAVVSGVAGSVLWFWMYHHELGIVNNLLPLVGLQGWNWLYDTNTV